VSRVRTLLIGYFLIALIGGWPILSLAIAGTIAELNGCRLHEGFVNPCVVDGQDIGQTLYTMGVMGFMAIATIPIGIVLFLVWPGVWLVLFIRRRNAAQALGA
jgi:hypothetical protein